METKEKEIDIESMKKLLKEKIVKNNIGKIEWNNIIKEIRKKPIEY